MVADNHGLGIDRDLGVSHAIGRQYPILIHQQLDEKAARIDLRCAQIIAFTDSACFRFERDTQETVIQIQIDALRVGPNRVTCMVGDIGFRNNAKHAPEAVNHKMVSLDPAHKFQQIAADARQSGILIGGQGNLCAFAGMEDDSCRVGPPFGGIVGIGAVPEDDVRTGHVRRAEAAFDSQTVAVDLIIFCAFHHPDIARRNGIGLVLGCFWRGVHAWEVGAGLGYYLGFDGTNQQEGRGQLPWPGDAATLPSGMGTGSCSASEIGQLLNRIPVCAGFPFNDQTI